MKILIDNIKNIEKLNSESVVLDIETTGVSRINSKVLIASIIKDKNKFVQYAIESEDEELDLLKELSKSLENKHIITYNGKIFDIPFIKSRLLHHEIPIFNEKSQFDLYRYIKKNELIIDIEKFSLLDIEKYLGIERFENFEKDYDINFYKNNNIDLINSEVFSHILLHNKYDVLNTAKALRLVDIIENKKTIDLLHFKNCKIKNINIEKEILYIDIDLIDNNMDYFFTYENFELNISKKNAHIKIITKGGYLSEHTIGYVTIFNPNDYFLKFYDDNFDLIKPKYSIPKNFIEIYDGKYIIENIKFIIKFIFTKMFDEI